MAEFLALNIISWENEGECRINLQQEFLFVCLFCFFNESEVLVLFVLKHSPLFKLVITLLNTSVIYVVLQFYPWFKF